MNAVDTNVFIYALDVDDAFKQAKALELLQRLTAAGRRNRRVCTGIQTTTAACRIRGKCFMKDSIKGVDFPEAEE